MPNYSILRINMNSNFDFQSAKSLSLEGDNSQSLSFSEDEQITSIQQGDPESIANSLNNYFAPQGIRTKVA